MTHLTFDTVRVELWEIIVEQGEDYIYEIPDGGTTCRYVYDGAPSCLIGRYLVELGVPVEAFEGDRNFQEVDDLYSDGFLERYGITAEPEAVLAMAEVQRNQDNFHPWGDAHNRAFEIYYEED